MALLLALRQSWNVSFRISLQRPTHTNNSDEKNYAVPLHHSFLRNLPTIFIMFCDKNLFSDVTHKASRTLARLSQKPTSFWDKYSLETIRPLFHIHFPSIQWKGNHYLNKQNAILRICDLVVSAADGRRWANTIHCESLSPWLCTNCVYLKNKRFP